MTLETWILFCITELVLCAIPGPGVLLIISLSLTRGASSGVAATMGILLATIIYFFLAASGLGAILQASSEVFSVVKFVGAAYLLWLGVSLLRSAVRGQGDPEWQSADESVGRSFWHGFVTHAANPKLLIF